MSNRYGSGDFAFGRYLQNRRFDLAMVALLDCMKQLMEVAVKREPGFRLPFSYVSSSLKHRCELIAR